MSAVSRDFEEAYGGLRALVGRIVAGEVGEGVLREAVDGWRREDCKGAATLSKAAALSLRYDLASGGLRGGGRVPDELRALGRVEGVLDPPERTATGTRDAHASVSHPNRKPHLGRTHAGEDGRGGPRTPSLWAWLPPPGSLPQHAGGAGGLVHLYDEDYENAPPHPKKSR